MEQIKYYTLINTHKAQGRKTTSDTRMIAAFS